MSINTKVIAFWAVTMGFTVLLLGCNKPVPLEYTNPMDPSNPLNSDQSISLHWPASGETYISGAVAEIIWESSNIDTVSIQYTMDQGLSWHNIVRKKTIPGVDKYNWQVPYVTSTTSCWVIVRDGKDGTPYDFNDPFFNIVP